MPFLVYVQDSATGRVLKFGAYDEVPFIISRDGSHFVDIPNFDAKELLKPKN